MNNVIKTTCLLILSIFVLALVSCVQENNTNEEITVFSGGETEYSIITAESACKDATELSAELARLSGASPAISTDTADEGAKEILIGLTNRGASSEIQNKLTEEASSITFSYVIAEVNGKIVILSETDVGYVYALDYIKEKYIADGKFTITEGTCDIQKVLWDDYYTSELYYERLLEEEENNKNNSDKPSVDIGTGEMITLEQAIKDYQNKIAAFSSTDFGTYTSSTFIKGNKYAAPSVYPEKGEHPRILFTENSIDEVRANIKSDESKIAYDKYIQLSNYPFDGKFKPLSGSESDNYDGDKAARIEAKAFRYAMTGEKIYGYEAIYAAKNAILTIDVKRSVSDYCRRYGHLMYIVSCVYDWCYDLLTDLDKEQLICGCVNILGYMQEVVSQSNLNNLVPTGQGSAYGHGAEDQLLVDYFAFAIACYDEAPEIYDLVAGRILEEHVPHQNYLAKSGTFWEGTMYGGCRGTATLMSNILFSKMTDGAFAPFTNLVECVTALTYLGRADGSAYRLGDSGENRTYGQYVWIGNNCFFAGNFYNNSYLKTVAYEYFGGLGRGGFMNSIAGLSCVQFLAVNDPSVSHEYDLSTAPLTYTSTYPYINLFAKSKNNGDDAFGVYMSMQAMFAPSHGHAEAGAFQLFYKGGLVVDTGSYSTVSWDGHHYNYYKQTIGTNSILVYNPAIAKEWETNPPAGNKTLIYSGGQIMIPSYTPKTLDELMVHDLLGQTQSLGTKSVEKDGELVYTYLGGDMTGAYDERTVDEVSRYMIAVATGDINCPYAFLTFDRITSDDADFHKSALVHVQVEPTETDSGFIIVSNTEGTSNGKLVLQNVGYDTEYTIIGGEGKQFWLPGLDENGNYSLEDGTNADAELSGFTEEQLKRCGWGRVEISPAKGTEQKTNHILTVMYVTDADNESANVKAKNLCTDTLSGTEIFGKAVFFPKNEKLLSSEASFTLDASADTCYVAGVKAGTWNILKDGQLIDTVTVGGGRIVDGTYTDGEHIITFAAGAGNYTLAPVN